MINPCRRQLITCESDDLGLRNHLDHAFQGSRFYDLGHMGSLEHAKKSLAVFGRCVYKVPNGNVDFNLLKLGSDVGLGLALFGGRKCSFGGRFSCGSTGGWPDGGGTADSGWLSLTIGAVGL